MSYPSISDIEATVTIWRSTGVTTREAWWCMTGRRVERVDWCQVIAFMVRWSTRPGYALRLKQYVPKPIRGRARSGAPVLSHESIMFLNDPMALLDTGSPRPPPYGWLTSCTKNRPSGSGVAVTYA